MALVAIIYTHLKYLRYDCKTRLVVTQKKTFLENGQNPPKKFKKNTCVHLSLVKKIQSQQEQSETA